MKRVFINILFFLFAFNLFPRVNKITVSAIGDIMLHYEQQVYALLEDKGYLTLFEPTNKIFLSDDLTIGNLETPVNDDLPVKGYPQFNAKSSLLDAIKVSGIEVLSFANNHTLDQGLEGISSTANELRKRNLIFAGAGESPKDAESPIIINKNGIIIAYLSATWTTNIPQKEKDPKKPYVNIISYYNNKNLEEYAKEIKKIKRNVDVVILSYHAGNEYVSMPVIEKEKAMKLFAESGVDIILGHHPHVLQKIEYYKTKDNRTTLIAYSLGNFISAQSRYIPELNKTNNWLYESLLSKTSESVILQFEIIKWEGQISIINARIIPIFNTTFFKKINNNNIIGYKTFFIEDIFNENIFNIFNNEEITINYQSLKKVSEYRLDKIKKLISIPVILLKNIIHH